MRDDGYSLIRTLWSALIRFGRPTVPVGVAARNTAAVILPLAAGFVLQQPIAGVSVSVGALTTMFADQPGPYRQRLEITLLVALAGALSGLSGFLVGGHLVLLLVAMAVWGFGAGIMVMFGPPMTRVGMTSMILLIVTTATPLSWWPALETAGLIFAGGLLQTAVSIAAWPLGRYRPERQALAAVYRDLARLALQPPRNTEAPPVTDSLTQLQQTLLGRNHAHGRAMEAFHTLMELAERIRLTLMTSTQEDATPAGTSTSTSAWKRQAAEILTGIAQALEHAAPPRHALQAARKLRPAASQAGDIHAAETAFRHTLAGQLRAAARNARWAGSRGEIRARRADIRLPRALRSVAPLRLARANLRLSSIAFRHALRCSVVLVAAMAAARYAHLSHGYWLAMTAAIVLRPDFGSTLHFGFLRVLGTLLGLVVTSALLYLSPDSVWPHLALLAALCFAFRYLAGAHYGVAVAALTGTVVILLAFEGMAPGATLSARVVGTVIGSIMALLAYVLWPSWERRQIRPALATMLDAYAGYLEVLANRHSEPDRRRDARAKARVARSNARASLDRLRAEPATQPALLQLATSLVANGNRLVRTAMNLEALLDEPGDLPGRARAQALMQAAAETLKQMAAATGTPAAPPPTGALRALQQDLAGEWAHATDLDTAATLEQLGDRLVDNIDTLAHVLASAQGATQDTAYRKALADSA